MLERELMVGTTETEFSPNTPITRAMVVTILGRLSGVDMSSYTESTFSDVDSSKYYSSYVSWAKNSSITSGVSETEFSPNTPITREQMALLLMNYMTYKNIDLEETNPEYEFADSTSIKNWSEYSVYQMQKYGILAGRDDGSFDP